MTLDSSFHTSTCERPATGADTPFLRHLFDATLARIPGFSAEQFEALTEMQFRGREQSYAEQYAHAKNIIISFVDGTRVGRVLTELRPGCLRLVDIAVLPEYQGLGIGTATLLRLQSEADRHGVALRLSVRASNRALKLYTRLGFSIFAQGCVSLEMVWCPREVRPEIKEDPSLQELCHAI